MEILLVIIIIGILALGVTVGLVGRTREAAISRTRANIDATAVAADIFEMDFGRYPASLDELTADNGQPQWRGPYIKRGKQPIDGWGNKLQFSVDEKGVKITSAGPDRSFGGDDDLWN